MNMIRIRPFGVLFRIFVMCLAGSPWGRLSFSPSGFLSGRETDVEVLSCVSWHEKPGKRQKTHTETDVAQLTSVSWQEVTYNFVDLLNKK